MRVRADAPPPAAAVDQHRDRAWCGRSSRARRGGVGHRKRNECDHSSGVYLTRERSGWVVLVVTTEGEAVVRQCSCRPCREGTEIGSEFGQLCPDEKNSTRGLSALPFGHRASGTGCCSAWPAECALGLESDRRTATHSARRGQDVASSSYNHVPALTSALAPHPLVAHPKRARLAASRSAARLLRSGPCRLPRSNPHSALPTHLASRILRKLRHVGSLRRSDRTQLRPLNHAGEQRR